MAELVYVAARREAAALLSDHWDGELPVKLSDITAAVNAEKFETVLDSKMSGLVSKEEDKPARIVLNAAHSAGRRRFTWAHELGHVVERRSLAQDDDYSFTDYRGVHYDLHEFFADEFAGALLMPTAEFERAQADGLTDAELARLFGVSVGAVEKRSERLRKQPETASTHG